jgi:hypothetical protein
MDVWSGVSKMFGVPWRGVKSDKKFKDGVFSVNASNERVPDSIQFAHRQAMAKDPRVDPEEIVADYGAVKKDGHFIADVVFFNTLINLPNGEWEEGDEVLDVHISKPYRR